MQQEQLKIFIESIRVYFQKMTAIPVEVGVPYLQDNTKTELLQFTGAIGISGKMRGAIYLTAEKNFIFSLIDKIMPGSEKTRQHLISMVGELANTIAGNAQRTLGPEFHISIPMIISSEQQQNENSLEIKAPTFIIPLKWQDHKAFLGVGLEKGV